MTLTENGNLTLWMLQAFAKIYRMVLQIQKLVTLSIQHQEDNGDLKNLIQ